MLQLPLPPPDSILQSVVPGWVAGALTAIPILLVVVWAVWCWWQDYWWNK